MDKQRPTRKCRRCGGKLARDNRAVLCRPCESSGFGATAAPPRFPDEFWERPVMRKALVSRDFGAVLDAYRQASQAELGHKITQAELGSWLGISQVHVGRLEHGITPADNITKLARWAAVLGVPPRHLWFQTPQADDVYESRSGISNLRSTTNAEGDDVHRRQFLKTASLGAATLGTSLLAVNGGPDQPEPGIEPITDPDVESVRALTETYRRLDNRFGGGHSKTAMTAYMTAVVEPKLKDTRTTGRTRGELFSAVAELYQLAGWMAYDVGQAVDGRRHMRHALRLSQEAGNDALSAEMLAGMSHHAAFHGAPGDAVDLALAAGQIARRSGTASLRAEAAVMEAHGLALQGERHTSLKTLHTAERLFATADVSDVPPWLRYFDTAYLAAKFAHTFRDLGNPQQAETFARRSLEMSDGYERGKLFNTALLSSILADQRRVDEACAVGLSAVRMSSSVRSVRSAAYLADVAHRLAPFRDTANVRALYEHMVDAGIPVPPA